MTATTTVRVLRTNRVSANAYVHFDPEHPLPEVTIHRGEHRGARLSLSGMALSVSAVDQHDGTVILSTHVAASVAEVLRQPHEGHLPSNRITSTALGLTEDDVPEDALPTLAGLTDAVRMLHPRLTLGGQ